MATVDSKRSWSRPAVVAAVLLAVAALAAFAGVQGGFWGKARGAYDRWSLRSRVDALWESRLKGDILKSEKFVIDDGKPRAALGGAIRYLAYEVREMKIEDEKAEVHLRIQYRLDLPGFSEGSETPVAALVKQSWVRTGGDWYWDPGPVSGSPVPVRVDPEPPAAGSETPAPVPPTRAAPTPVSAPGTVPKR